MLRYERQYELILDHKEPLDYQQPIGDNRTLLSILEVLFKEVELSIYKHDKDGNVRFNDKGYPRINWIGVLWNLGKIIARVLQMRAIHNAMKR